MAAIDEVDDEADHEDDGVRGGELDVEQPHHHKRAEQVGSDAAAPVGQRVLPTEAPFARELLREAAARVLYQALEVAEELAARLGAELDLALGRRTGTQLG